MKRDKVLDRIENTKEPWDILVIGGGATGLGVAVDDTIRAKVVVNATGVFCDSVRRMDELGRKSHERSGSVRFPG
jgi:glycerol-3-phosphate dehydrogenase